MLKRASGFVYYVSVTGVTGVKEADAGAVARVADAVVVGSALVEEIAGALARNETPTRKVLEKAHSLAQAVREARVRTTV